MYDILILNGEVYDGTGDPPRKAGVAVAGDRIVKVGRPEGARAVRTIDAAGRIVCPGFIDVHSHGDLLMAAGDEYLHLHKGRISQGITTEVVGNCGIGPAPLDQPSKPLLMKMYTWMDPSTGGRDWPWESFGDFLDRLDEVAPPANVAALLAHGPVRITAMGLRAGEPSASELDRMKGYVREAMEVGAYGLSSGLIYPPGMYTSTDELVALSREMAPYGGIYTSHIRGSSSLLIPAVEELLEIGRKAGVKVQHSHHEAFGEEHFQKLDQTLTMEEKARQEGISVGFDVFPYTAAATNMFAIYPPWTIEGGVDAFLDRIRDPSTRQRLQEEIETFVPSWPPWPEGGWSHNLVRAVGWKNVYVAAGLTKNPSLIGKNMVEVGEIMRKSPFDALCDLMLEEGGTISQFIFGVSGDRSNDAPLRKLIQHPMAAISTDANDSGRGLPHPAAYGTYPRVLGRYVRELGLVSMSEAIRKMTSLPASQFGLTGRGTLVEGNFADLVVFDPEAIGDRATWEEPRRLCQGVEHVLINGRTVIEDGTYKPNRAGRVLRRGS